MASLLDLGNKLKDALWSATPVGQTYNAVQRAVPKIQQRIQNYGERNTRAAGVMLKAEPAYNAIQGAIRSIPAAPFRASLPQIQKAGTQFVQNANQFIQGGINKGYSQAPIQVPAVVKPFTVLPEMGRVYAQNTLTDLNLGLTTGRPETNRLHELTTKRRTPQEQKEFINLATNEGLQLAMGMVGGGEKLNTQNNLSKAYQEFAHNLGAVIKQAGRKFTQEELDNAINVLAKAPIDQAPDQYHRNASAIARYIQGVKSGLLVNKPGGVGLQARPLRSVQEADRLKNTKNQTKFVPSKTEKNLGMEGGATPLPLSQNKGVVGQPTGSDKKVSIGGTGVIPEEKMQSFEQQLASSELDDTLRKMYSSDEIGVFNRVKQMARAKDVQNGDVETLYKKNQKLVESALQSVKEKEPNITSNDEAFQYILDLPTAKDATTPKPPTESFGMGDMAYNAQATPKTLEKIRVRDIKAQERAAKAEFDAWQRQYREKTVSPLERVKAVEQSIKSNTSSPVSKDPEALKDISGWQAYMRDVYRNFKAVYGDRFDEAKRIMLDPLDRSKGQYVDMTENWAKKLKTDIVDRFNIRKGSKESAAVQQYGEGILSDSDLVTQFGAKKAQEIKAADQWFRLAYDELINIVNAVRKRIYPNNPEKWVAKRQDYYRHFREMKEGLGALFNIFDTPSNISSTLAGISEGTKPKAKFLSIAQQRKGERTTYDAVGGFIDYIKQASYATHIDPHIERFRNLSKELGESTTESKNLNTFVSYLNRFADDLSGKTNAADRFAQEIIPGGRTTFRAINWLNNRVKSNAVIGNASSALSQIMNVPQGIADAGVPNAIKGIGRTLAGIFMDSPVVKRSTFLRERYSDPFSQFDTGIINDVGKFAKWMTGVLDKVGSNVIWNSQYEKALKLGVKDAVKFADDATRSLVAGRGIGEVPLLQKARVMQLVAPFQLEVQNLWWVLKDMKDQKAFGKIATFFVVNHLMNKAIEGIRGSDVTFDPIQSVMDGYKSFQEEEDKTKGAIKFAGRQAGEVLSNVPFGQTIASLYPEYGATIGDTKLPTRRDLFGKGNPVRQGSGLLAVEGLKDPLYKIIPPYGGAQLKKTIEGLQSVGQGFVGKPDAVKYPVEQSAGNVVRGAVFGKGALPETKEYYEENRRPLGEKQSAVYHASSDKKNAYKTMIDKRKEDALDEKAKNELKSKGGGSLEKNGKVYVIKENGEINTIDPLFQPSKPILTGQAELDKKLISKFNGQITSKANDIVDLYEAGKLTQQEAENQLDALKTLKSSYSTKKSGSAKKISIKKITPKKLFISLPKPKKLSAFRISSPKSPKLSTKKNKTIKIKAGKPITFKRLKGLSTGKRLV